MLRKTLNTTGKMLIVICTLIITSIFSCTVPNSGKWSGEILIKGRGTGPWGFISFDVSSGEISKFMISNFHPNASIVGDTVQINIQNIKITGGRFNFSANDGAMEYKIDGNFKTPDLVDGHINNGRSDYYWQASPVNAINNGGDEYNRNRHRYFE